MTGAATCNARKRRRVDDEDEDEYLEELTPTLDEEPQVILHPNSHSRAQHILKPSEARILRKDLLDWYKIVHANRAMPWRRPFHEPIPSDPVQRAHRAYQVWISEIMCQQTQVATVIPYYNRWMQRFPTIQDLASSDIETVHTIWKGLGYYSRASRLLSGAQKVVKEFEGQLPEDPKELEKEIPGIGRYSSGAISSIAYGIQAPVLDGNVHRLLSRLLAVHASGKSKATLDILWAAAKTFVDGSDCKFPGDVNQALIELGSTVCRVKDPICDTCPLKGGCQAFKETNAGARQTPSDIEDLCAICSPHTQPLSSGVTRYPMKIQKKKAREETDLVLALEWRHDNERWVVLEKRPEEGLLGGLWNFPNIPCINPGHSQSKLDMLVPSIVTKVLDDPPPLELKVLRAKASSTSSEKRGRLTKYFKSKSGNSVADTSISLSPDRGDSNIIHAIQLQHAPPVLHIFSHIRKTYKSVHLVIEGGSHKPVLCSSRNSATKKKRLKSSEKRKRSEESSENEATPSESVQVVGELKWVKWEDMDDTNIGTGIAKVWKNIKGLEKGSI